MMRRTLRTAAAVILFLCALQRCLWAQDVWLDQGKGNSISLEYMKPFLDSEDYSFMTSAWFLTGRKMLIDRLAAVIEVPIAHSGRERSDRSSTAVGNPYLGIEFFDEDGPSSVEIGFRAPIASNDKGNALIIGEVTDFDRWEAFAPDVFSFNLKGVYRREYRSGGILRVRLGPSVWVNTESGGSSEVLLDYSVVGGGQSDRFLLTAGLSGRLILTNEGAGLAERTVHHLGFDLLWKRGAYKPGLHLRIPLDQDLTGIVNFILGFNLTIDFD